MSHDHSQSHDHSHAHGAATIEGERPAEHGQPRASLAVLNRRATVLTIAGLVILAGIAWWLTVRQAQSMGDMVSGLGQVGTLMPNDMTIPVFMAMWVLMMVAMMFPTIAPHVLVHRSITRKRGEGPWVSWVFVLGYIVIWSVIGLVPLAAFLLFRNLAADVDMRWIALAAGGTLVVAGAYQFTPWKNVCLKHCRTPFDFILTHDWGGGARAAFRAGISHGVWCLGCCWALMAVLVVVGLMNLVWMAAIAIVFLLEKNWKHGVLLTRIVGAGLVVLGLVVMVNPDVLPSISGGSADMPMDMDDMDMEDGNSDMGDMDMGDMDMGGM